MKHSWESVVNFAFPFTFLRNNSSKKNQTQRQQPKTTKQNKTKKLPHALHALTHIPVSVFM